MRPGNLGAAAAAAHRVAAGMASMHAALQPLRECLWVHYTGMMRGHGTRWDSARGCWVYTDTGDEVDMTVPFGGATRPCGACGQLPTPEGHDACIASLPGVRFACCGHGYPDGVPGQGRTGRAYVTLMSGHVLLGDEALAFFAEHGRQVPVVARA